MKKIFILFFFLFTSALESKALLSNEDIPNYTSNKKIVVKIETIGNSDLYYAGTMIFCEDTVKLLQNYVHLKVYKEKEFSWLCNNYGRIQIIVSTSEDTYTVYGAPINQIKDTFKYVLNYDNLNFKEIEIEKREKKEKEIIQKKSNKEYEEELRQLIINDAEEKRTYYENKIHGKKHNVIADYLYEEGFTRSFSSGAVLKEDYTTDFTFNDLPGKVYYTLKISMWNSYGYGKLYYSIDYYYWINNHFYSTNSP